MRAKLRLTGPVRYRARAAAVVSRSVAQVSLHRMWNGPRRPGWNWFLELATQVLKNQLAVAFQMADVNEIRRYLDCFTISSGGTETERSDVVRGDFKGAWFTPNNATSDCIVLYLHGGGYSFYPKAYAHFIGLIAHAAKSRTFALDYRLAPEHCFPAQLEDAVHAYRWLLESGGSPDNLVIAGDSAGGNLALALLLSVRESKIPPPALAIALSPATGFLDEQTAMASNEVFDWIDRRMFERWANWFCGPTQRSDPLVSPIFADLCGLAPIYLQAGGDEILFDGIQAFAARAKSHGADVVLESWEHMNHVFQVFGPDVPQSAEALRRIGDVIDQRVRGQHTAAAFAKDA